MVTRSFLAAIFILALLVQPAYLIGQAAGKYDWSSVRALAPGTSVSVQTKSGKSLEGILESVSDNAISISRRGSTESIASTDIKKLHRVDRGSRGKSIAIGTAVGAGIGVGAGAAALGATGGSDETGAVLAGFIALGAGIGAALGAVLGRKNRTLIYESR